MRILAAEPCELRATLSFLGQYVPRSGPSEQPRLQVGICCPRRHCRPKTRKIAVPVAADSGPYLHERGLCPSPRPPRHPDEGHGSTRSSPDSPLEGNGFEISVPRQVGSGFEASVGLGPIDSRRGGITRAVVGLGKPIELFRRRKEPPLTRRNEGAHAVGGGEASRN